MQPFLAELVMVSETLVTEEKYSGTELRDLEVTLVFKEDSKRHRPDTESRHPNGTILKDRKVTVEELEL